MSRGDYNAFASEGEQSSAAGRETETSKETMKIREVSHFAFRISYFALRTSHLIIITIPGHPRILASHQGDPQVALVIRGLLALSMP